jgi:hypothetical protein
VVKTVRVKHGSDGNQISWETQAQAATYRVYRLRPGSPPVWLDSPYKGGHPLNDSISEWRDADGKADDDYRVHAVNPAGQESAW